MGEWVLIWVLITVPGPSSQTPTVANGSVYFHTEKACESAKSQLLAGGSGLTVFVNAFCASTK